MYIYLKTFILVRAHSLFANNNVLNQFMKKCSLVSGNAPRFFLLMMFIRFHSFIYDIYGISRSCNIRRIVFTPPLIKVTPRVGAT